MYNVYMYIYIYMFIYIYTYIQIYIYIHSGYMYSGFKNYHQNALKFFLIVIKNNRKSRVKISLQTI